MPRRRARARFRGATSILFRFIAIDLRDSEETIEGGVGAALFGLHGLQQWGAGKVVNILLRPHLWRKSEGWSEWIAGSWMD